jgi:hypothetical protein
MDVETTNLYVQGDHSRRALIDSKLDVKLLLLLLLLILRVDIVSKQMMGCQ